MKYVVNEIQKTSDGDIYNNTSTYETLQDAEDAYDEAVKNAENSEFPAHIVVLMGEGGAHIKHESYVHT